MQAMVCEMCGSSNLVKQDGLYVCQNCGTKYSVEEARKLLGTVKIDRTEETEKLLVLARRAREMNNGENAEKYYEMVLRDNPNNWEAAFFQVYYQAMQCNIIGISNAATAVANNIDTVFQLISEIEDYEEQEDALDMVISYSHSVSAMFTSAALNHYDAYSNVNNALLECSERIVSVLKIHQMLEISMKSYFPTDTERIIVVQKAENSFITKHSKFIDSDFCRQHIKRLTNEIKAYDPSYSRPSGNGGCYIATAVYGSYDCPEVWTLRRYRDQKLALTSLGRAFIRCYYAISPTVVRVFGKSELFHRFWKKRLDKMVQRLNAQGFSSDRYQD